MVIFECSRSINSIEFSDSRYLNDLKSTPIFSLQSSLSKHANTSSAQVTPVQVSKTTINTRKRNAANTPPVTTNQTLIPVQIVCSRLDQSVDMITAKAESLFYNNEYKNCSQVLEEYVECHQTKAKITKTTSILSFSQTSEERSLSLCRVNCSRWMFHGIERIQQ